MTDIGYLQQALIPMSSGSTLARTLPYTQMGTWAHLCDGTFEQNVIFHVVYHAATAGEAASH